MVTKIMTCNISVTVPNRPMVTIIHKCDVMGQNQLHVAKHKMAEICIFSENVHFLFTSKTKYFE